MLGRMALSVTLKNGLKMPLMGFGTLMESLEPDQDATVEIVKNAIDVGYRHLDCAQIYNTENAVGRAIKAKIDEGVVKREDLFVVTKLWRNAYARESVVPSLKKSLEQLGLSYVDLFLIHWPTAFKTGENKFPKGDDGKFIYESIDYLDTWKGMEECLSLGLTKSIGVSNFNSKQLQRIMDNCTIVPSNNQVESHPFLTNTKLVNWCHSKGITVTAYAPLGGFNADYRIQQGWSTIFDCPTIQEVAKKNNATPAQVSLRYQMQRGVAVVPKTSKRSRMEENFKALDITLDAADMQAIEGCNSNNRLNAEFPDHPYYPFHEDF